MKRLLKKLPLLLFVLGLGSALAYGFRPQPVPVDVAPVKRGAMQVTVDEDGKTRLKQVYVVSAPLPGNLRRVKLKPGAPVVKDQTLLAIIEPKHPDPLDWRTRQECEARKARAEAAVEQTRAVLEKAKE